MGKRDLFDKAAKAVGTIKDAQALVDDAFSPLDHAFQTFDDSEKTKFIELLNETEEKVKQMGNENQDWWMSEVYLRKARCAKGIFEKGKEYLFWKQAYEYGRKSNNHEVIIQSGLSLGFDLFEFTASIREIIEIQMNCIKAICAQGSAIFTGLRIMGINLFNFWRQIEYRRLSEHELKAKQLVIDGAKNLEEAGFDEDRAAPIMIMLISNLFEFKDPCIEWAQHEAAILDIQIPETIKRKINFLDLKIPTSD
jgi:hypothetical protein